jgi:putative heme-binding domain-containing protein
MRGMLFVTNNLEEFLVKNPQKQIKVTEWKVSDFTDDLKRVGEHRKFAEGKLLFATLGCVQCHKLNKDDKAGGVSIAGLNQSVGPNVDDSTKKLKRDAKALLQEILEPSRNIEEKYRQVLLELEDGRSLIGLVAAENATTLTLLSGTPAKAQDISKKSIDARRTSPLSLMPNGLLNTLDKEQILDLLAYLLAGGSADDSAFKHHH